MATALKPPDTDGDVVVGTRVGNYIVERRAGTTPVADVYRARHVTLGRVVSILLFDRTRSQRCRQRILPAAAIASRVRHQNVLEVYEAGELDDGRCFVVREWCEGRSLAEEIARRGRFSDAECLDLIEDVTAGVNALHAIGEAHGNLHASSLYVVPAGRFSLVKLGEFGHGRPHARGPYVAPEIVRGERGQRAADIHALGVLVHHLLTGIAPPPRQPLPHVDAVIDRCLAADPAARFEHVEALLSALRPALSPHEQRRSVTASRAIGLRVELLLESGEREHLTALADALALARASCVAVDLDIAREQPNALLAVRTIDGDDDTPATRERLLRAALQLFDHLRLEAPPVLHARLVLHEGTLLRRRAHDGFEYVGGSIVSVGSWPKGAVDGVVVTPEVAEQLRSRIAFEPVQPGLWRVRPA